MSRNDSKERTIDFKFFIKTSIRKNNFRKTLKNKKKSKNMKKNININKYKNIKKYEKNVQKNDRSIFIVFLYSL